MLFSVIVPIWNSENTLRPCVESVLNQTYGGFELILVDDGSRDDSFQICKAFSAADRRVQVIRQENQGHTAARNAGLCTARGDYVLFLDSDDWLETGLLEACKREAEAASPELILFGHKAHTCSTAVPVDLKRFRGRYDHGDDGPLFHKLILARDGTALPRALWGKAFSRELICKWLPQIPPEIITGEDMCCFIAAALEARTISVIPGMYYNYRVLPNSLSRKGDPQALARCRYTIDFLDRRIPPEQEEFRSQLYRLTIQQMYSALLRAVRSQADSRDIQTDMGRLRDHALCREAIEKADFSVTVYKIKKFIVKHRWVSAVKCIAAYKQYAGRNSD